MKPALLASLVACAPPPDCATPCGVAIYGTVDCAEYARLESDLMRRLPLPNACASVNGFAAYAHPGRTSVRDGVTVEGWTLCEAREIHMHVDWWAIWRTAYAHELVHAAQRCAAPMPVDVGEDDAHANWSRSGIRWALDDLQRARVKEDNERDKSPRP